MIIYSPYPHKLSWSRAAASWILYRFASVLMKIEIRVRQLAFDLIHRETVVEDD